MFKLFEKDFFRESNYSYEIIDKDICVASDGSIIKIYGNGEYWENIDRSKYLIVPKMVLTKENISFTLIEPADFAYIDVYRVGVYYVAHEYSDPYDLVGIYYMVDDINKFKKDKANSFTFISYHNYMEEF